MGLWASVASGLVRTMVCGDLFFARGRGDSGEKVSGGQIGFNAGLVEGVIRKGQTLKP